MLGRKMPYIQQKQTLLVWKRYVPFSNIWMQLAVSIFIKVLPKHTHDCDSEPCESVAVWEVIMNLCQLRIRIGIKAYPFLWGLGATF